MRAERGVTRRDVPWIVVVGGLGVAVVAGLVALWIYAAVSSTRERDRAILNDTAHPVLVGVCDLPCDTRAAVELVRPNERLTLRTNYDVFSISTPDGADVRCVDVADEARVSDADDC